MPDNAIYYQVAYGVLIALFAGYAYSIRVRRRAVERKRRAAEGQP
jgi:hypothetical protein